MTGKQYRKAIKALDLNQRQAGEFLAVGLRTSQAYALGESPVPDAVAKLLVLMIDRKLSVANVNVIFTRYAKNA